MADPKPKSIPHWQQLQSSQEPSKPQESSRDEHNTSTEDARLARTELIEKAAKFLEDDNIRDASTDRKIEFLKSKGLTSEETQELLGVTRNEDASSGPTTSASQPSSDTSSSEDSASKDQTQTTSPRNSPPLTSPPTSQPPIITYPEFLLHSPGPTPIFTTQLLLTTLYTTSFLAAAAYGTSTYLLTPMLESLHEARHELFQKAKDNLDNLNTTLEGVVSVIPPSAVSPPALSSDSDTESDISDPTELFHRDVGIQTSHPNSPPPEVESLNTIDLQAARLTSLRTHLSTLLEINTTSQTSDEDLSSSLTALQSFCDDLRFGRKGGLGATAYGIGATTQEDQVDAVKREIRGVKGVLLSAKSFPGGGRARVGA